MCRVIQQLSRYLFYTFGNNIEIKPNEYYLKFKIGMNKVVERSNYFKMLALVEFQWIMQDNAQIGDHIEIV